MFRGGCEHIVPNCVGMLLNDVCWERDYDFTYVKEVFTCVGIRDFAFMKDLFEVVPDLRLLRRGQEDRIDVWDDEERESLERQGGEIVVRKGPDSLRSGYDSVGEELSGCPTDEAELKNGLCGARFAFGGQAEMRIDIELSAGSVLTVFAMEIEVEEETDDDGDVAIAGNETCVDEHVRDDDDDDDDDDVLMVD